VQPVEPATAGDDGNSGQARIESGGPNAAIHQPEPPAHVPNRELERRNREPSEREVPRSAEMQFERPIGPDVQRVDSDADVVEEAVVHANRRAVLQIAQRAPDRQTRSVEARDRRSPREVHDGAQTQRPRA
jgi:hypothetical protein